MEGWGDTEARPRSVGQGLLNARIVSGDGSHRAQTQKRLKWVKDDSKLTFRGQPESESKSDSRSHFFESFLTRKSLFLVTLVSFLSHFQVDPEKSLLSHYRVTSLVFEFGLCSCRPHSQCKEGSRQFGGVPTTPDPNTSAKASWYKWEAYLDTNWWCIYDSLPRGGHTFAKVSR